MRVDKVVEFTGYFLNDKGEKNWIDVFNLKVENNVVHKLYQETQSHPLQHKDWNRAVFTLYPDDKFNMEYIWDQELQDRVDGHNARIRGRGAAS